MKYLFIARGFNEPDNNTPSEEICARVIECEKSELDTMTHKVKQEFAGAYSAGVEIKNIKLEDITKDWQEIVTIW